MAEFKVKVETLGAKEDEGMKSQFGVLRRLNVIQLTIGYVLIIHYGSPDN